MKYEYIVKNFSIIARQNGNAVAYITSSAGQFCCRFIDPVYFMTYQIPRKRFIMSTEMLRIILSGVFV